MIEGGQPSLVGHHSRESCRNKSLAFRFVHNCGRSYLRGERCDCLRGVVADVYCARGGFATRGIMLSLDQVQSSCKSQLVTVKYTTLFALEPRSVLANVTTFLTGEIVV